MHSVAAHDNQIGWPTPSEQADLRALIQRSLPSAGADSLISLARTGRLRHLRINETIFAQGEEVPLVLIVRGYIAFRRTTVHGQEVTVGIANPHEMYGITSISSTVSSVEMVALTDAEVAVWRGPLFRSLAEHDAGLALDVIDRLADFLNILTYKLDSFLHQDSRRRVIRVLARHRDLFFGDPPILARAHLPGLVGTSREMTGRVLRELEREGMVARIGRTGLRLLDGERLDFDAAGLSQEPTGSKSNLL
jgi:CRP-like cAMP-binding protein